MTGGYKGSEGLKGIRSGYGELQGATTGCKGLQRVTGGNKG